MMRQVPMPRQRRKFADEYKAEIVRLILVENRPVLEVCREHDLVESVVRRWLDKASLDDATKHPGIDLEAEVRRLRRENARLQQERDFLKKQRPSSPKTTGEISTHPGGGG